METTRTMLVSFITNLFLIIFKTLFGIVGHSGALIADAFHSFSDLIVDLFALIGLKVANKPADLKHPYGHGKLEYLISLIMGVTIVTLGITIIKDSMNKDIVIPSLLVTLVSIFTIIIKLLLSNYVISKGKKYKNNILISSGSESKSDVISSIIVITSVILMNLSDKISIFKYADIVATILVGMIIIHIGIEIIKDNVSVLLEEQETDIKIKREIEKIFLNDSKVYSIDDLTILKFGPYNKLIARVSMDHKLSLLEARNRMDKVEKKLLTIDKIKYVIIHIVPYINIGNYELRRVKKKDIKYIKNYNENDTYNIIYLDNKKIGNINYYLNNDKCYIKSITLIKRYLDKGIEKKIVKDFIDKYNMVIIYDEDNNYNDLGFKYSLKLEGFVFKK